MDFDEFEDCKQVDFYGIDKMLNALEDAGIELTNTPCRSSMANDFQEAMTKVRQTPLFQDIIKCIQTDLKTALAATPDDIAALQAEYKKHTILPKKYAKALLEY